MGTSQKKIQPKGNPLLRSSLHASVVEKAFTETPDASMAGQESGVIGVPEIVLLNE